MQGAGPGSAGRQPWTDTAVRLTISSGIGTLRLAAAEAAAQADSLQSDTGSRPPAHVPRMLRRQGAELLQAATSGVTSKLAHAFANDGMAHALMEVTCRVLPPDHVPGASYDGTLARSCCIHRMRLQSPLLTGCWGVKNVVNMRASVVRWQEALMNGIDGSP